MANVFTPNGDGKNDNFFFPGDLFQDVHCKIYDR
ncbi:MAG: gliding motility-associated C-terminal domain-containing protein [Bacteroidia bacterium]|nr:gliding motility-associated C-terminal domain-containing protein [Bacteroidia bacterium]